MRRGRPLGAGRPVAYPRRQVTELAIESAAEPLADEWEALADRAGAAPFLRPGWVTAWWAAFGAGDLQVLALRRDGRLAGVIPLRRSGRSLLSPANWHSPVFGPVAESPEAERELLRRTFALPVRSVDLRLLDASGGTLARALAAAREAGRLVLSRPLTRSPFVTLDGDWDAYERGLSRNRRKGVRRRLQGLDAQGAVSFEVANGETRLDALLEEAFAVEASGWKGERGTAMASRSHTRRFYADLARWAARRGWLRLAFLRLDGRPLAFDLAFEHAGTWYSLKAGYELEYRRYAPGVLLTYETLRHAFASGLRRFELLGDVDEFKLGWTRAERVLERAWMRAFATSSAGRAEATLFHARERARPIARRIRERTGA